MGRPSIYSQELADSICERIADGESLRAICSDESMPGRRTVLDWLDDDSKLDFRAKYARAREAQADWHADEIIELADLPRIGQKVTTKANGDEEVVTGDMVERARLQIDARKWYAAKLSPKKYGDKVTQEVTGKDGGAVQHEHTVGFESAASDLLTKIRG
jgi:hypothetical protein